MQTYPPGTRIGQYEIASRPMMGGMGVVYFALDYGNDGRPVALKTFRPEFLPDRAARDRFLREGTAWIELGSHPHIVRCYKVEYIDPTAFLVLELIAKEQNMPDASLRSWLIPGRPLPLEQALLFALQIARGMQYATEKIPGFVHRDLKPENILVGADRLSGTNINRLRVTDFGLVKTIASGDTSVATTNVGEFKPNQVQFTYGVGTPLYMAPEQWKGEPVGIYTDIYAFGCLLYEVFCGHAACKGTTSTELQTSHCTGNLQSIPRTLPKDLESLLANCLSLKPASRYQVWGEIIRGLESAYSLRSRQTIPRVSNDMSLSHAEGAQAGWSFIAIGFSYLNLGIVDKAILNFVKARSLGQKEKDLNLEGAAIGNLGTAYRNRGDINQSLECFLQALEVYTITGNKNEECAVLCNLAMSYTIQGNTHHAIAFYERSLLIARETKNNRAEAIIMGGLGNAHQDLGNLPQALDYFERSLEVSQQIQNIRGEGIAFGNIGNVYEEMGDYSRAIEFHERALKIDQGLGDRRLEGADLGNLGNAHWKLNAFDKAIMYYELQLNVTKETGDSLGTATALLNLASLYFDLGKYGQSLPLAQESAQVFARIGSPYVQRAQQLIRRLQESSEDKDVNEENPNQSALKAFQNANTPQEMEVVVATYPFMVERYFIQTLERLINEQVPRELRSEFDDRLVWLKHIIKR